MHVLGASCSCVRWTFSSLAQRVFFGGHCHRLTGPDSECREVRTQKAWHNFRQRWNLLLVLCGPIHRSSFCRGTKRTPVERRSPPRPEAIALRPPANSIDLVHNSLLPRPAPPLLVEEGRLRSCVDGAIGSATRAYDHLRTRLPPATSGRSALCRWRPTAIQSGVSSQRLRSDLVSRSPLYA